MFANFKTNLIMEKIKCVLQAQFTSKKENAI